MNENNDGEEDGLNDAFVDGLEAGQRIVENELSIVTRRKYRSILNRFTNWMTDNYPAGIGPDGTVHLANLVSR